MLCYLIAYRRCAIVATITEKVSTCLRRRRVTGLIRSVVPGNVPRTMVHDNGSQVVKMTILSAQSRPGHAAHGERGHVERLHREIHLRVHLRAIGIAPPKSFNVKAQHLRKEREQRMSIDHRVLRQTYFSARSKFSFRVTLRSCELYRSEHACPRIN